jgi:NAD(P)-dependent dehydrogenase (short-subunit alcohol dehydrogenase family)
MDTDSQAPLILITGGSRGVGAAMARLAAAKGYDVAISYISNESADLAVAADVEAVGRLALPVRADSADPEQSLNCSPRSTESSAASTCW